MCNASRKMSSTTAASKSLPAEDVGGVGVSFEGLSYSVKTKNKENPVLDVLAGRKTAGTMTGQVLFNGKVPTRDDFRFTVGYVEQFDTLVGELNVENM